jgi:hypothetical protein
MAPTAPNGAAAAAGAAGGGAAAPAHAAAASKAEHPPGSPPPWLVTSEHLDPDLPQTKQLHLVVLNWHLPVLTARLWATGEGGPHRPFLGAG